MISANESLAGSTVTLGQMEKRCADFEANAAALEEQIAALEADLEAVKQKHLRAIKRQAGIVAGLEAELRTMVDSAPELFKKPRTLTIHGVKVGFAVSNGRVVWDDEAAVLARIKKHFPEDTDVLIRTTEEPNKDALRVLSAQGLAKLSCSIEGAGDVVLVKRVAGDVEKLMNKLMEKLVESMVAE